MPPQALYHYKVECLVELERLSSGGEIDLYYGDESGVCREGYVPYGWQFKGERVSVPSDRNGDRLNCFAIISRESACHWMAATETMNAEKICGFLDQLSWGIKKKTVIVLDCAALHRGKVIKERLAYWRRRGLWLFYLPPYSPHLNLCETLWRILKGKWLSPEDYQTDDDLFYATNRCLADVGIGLTINYTSTLAA